MLDKVSGKVAYAILPFGGFLGMGDDYRPLPLSELKYDTDNGGYVINVSSEKLKGAPRYAAGSEPAWDDPNYNQQVYGYFGKGEAVLRISDEGKPRDLPAIAAGWPTNPAGRRPQAEAQHGPAANSTHPSAKGTKENAFNSCG